MATEMTFAKWIPRVQHFRFFLFSLDLAYFLMVVISTGSTLSYRLSPLLRCRHIARGEIYKVPECCCQPNTAGFLLARRRPADNSLRSLYKRTAEPTKRSTQTRKEKNKFCQERDACFSRPVYTPPVLIDERERALRDLGPYFFHVEKDPDFKLPSILNGSYKNLKREELKRLVLFLRLPLSFPFLSFPRLYRELCCCTAQPPEVRLEKEQKSKSTRQRHRAYTSGPASGIRHYAAVITRE